MADREELEFTTTKRARLSSENSFDQNDSSFGASDKNEPQDSSISRLNETEQSANAESFSSETTSREQHVGQVGHERLESEDFPTCFSVEDGLDDLDEHHYQPIAGPMGWIQRQMNLDINPEDILAYMVPHAQLPPNIDKSTLWKIIVDILTEPTPRPKLDHINSLDDVVELLRGSKNIIVLTGAGVSVSCGIPDFRSRDGIYAKLSVEYPDLPDPQAMFDISYFYQNPRPFFKFAKEIYPGQFKPSLGHRFISQLESNGQLLKNYSQNIDTLEQIAGITRVIQCHGSFSTASCTNCKHQVSCEAIREDIFQQVIPLCPKCPQDGSCFAIMKPDIVFFGESLPSEFYHNLDEDSEKADLLIVIGSSLKVRPVALIPSHVPPEVPQVLINREPLRHMTFDVELLGDCDVIISELCQRLGGAWNSLLEDVDRPCLGSTSWQQAQATPEKVNTIVEERPGVESEVSGRQENEQTPQSTPNNESTALQDIKRMSEDASRVSPLCPKEGHVTVGESSVCAETSDEPCRDQPRASGSGQENEYNDTSCQEDSPRFLFMPPSRYIFYGAEVMDSPLPSPSPSRNLTSYLDSTSEGSDSDSVGEIDDHEATGDQLDGIIEELLRHERSLDNAHQTTTNSGQAVSHSSESDCNSDDGFGEGDVDKGSKISNSEVTKQALSLILGGLSSYTCASEENSRLSAGSDDPVAPGSSDPYSLSHATDTLLTDRPFSGVTMDKTPTMPDHLEPGEQEQIKDTGQGNSECLQHLVTEDDVDSDVNAAVTSDSLHP
ncbi:hypothetical protein ACROYT_G006746 [Oculina patagonica]